MLILLLMVMCLAATYAGFKTLYNTLTDFSKSRESLMIDTVFVVSIMTLMWTGFILIVLEFS